MCWCIMASYPNQLFGELLHLLSNIVNIRKHPRRWNVNSFFWVTRADFMLRLCFGGSTHLLSPFRLRLLKCLGEKSSDSARGLPTATALVNHTMFQLKLDSHPFLISNNKNKKNMLVWEIHFRAHVFFVVSSSHETFPSPSMSCCWASQTLHSAAGNFTSSTIGERCQSRLNVEVLQHLRPNRWPKWIGRSVV